MWFFWKGEKQWKVHRPLTDEEKRFPKGPSLPSAPLLIERIEKDFRVERDYISYLLDAVGLLIVCKI